MKRIAIIGADSTHVFAFVSLMENNKKLNSGFRIDTVVLDKKSKMNLSQSRIPKVLDKLSSYKALKIEEDMSKVLGFDGYMILNVDAGLHLDLFSRLSGEDKPVFIDKPLAYDLQEAKEIFALAEEKGVKIMSSSAFRFSPFVRKAMVAAKGDTLKIVVKGPLYFEIEVPDYHWYGIHLFEMLETVGDGVLKPSSWRKDEKREIVEGTIDGIPFLVEGYLDESENFSVTVVKETGEQIFKIEEDEEPLYVYLLIEIIQFFKTGIVSVEAKNTLSILEALDTIGSLRKIENDRGHARFIRAE